MRYPNLSEKLLVGRFLPRDSRIHDLDPRVKVVIGFAYTLLVFQLESFLPLLIASLLLLIVIYQARLNLAQVASGFKVYVILLSLTCLFHAWSQAGDPIVEFLPFSWQGLIVGLIVVWRILLIILAGNLFSLTTNPNSLVLSIEYFLTPLHYLGLPKGLVGLVVVVGFRFVPVLLQETDRLLKAQIARGCPLNSSNIITKIQAYTHILIPLVVRIFQHADSLSVTMESRGFRLGQPRTALSDLRLGFLDILYLAVGMMMMYWIWRVHGFLPSLL